jgi:branched-chain amino acid transport system permease protein
MIRRVSRQARDASGFFVILCAVGLFLPDYRLLVVNQHLFLAINVLALNFCLGLGGQISLAQGGMAGLGAYASVLAHAHFPQASAAIVPAVALFAFALAAAVSRPMERLGEGFLAMATLGLSLIFTNLVLTMQSLTGGSAGMMVETRLSLPLVGPLSGDRTFFFLFLGLLALGCWMFSAIKNSRLGRALLAIKDDPLAASSCGIDRPAVRSLSFGLGGAFSALAGCSTPTTADSSTRSSSVWNCPSRPFFSWSSAAPATSCAPWWPSWSWRRSCPACSFWARAAPWPTACS